MKHPIPRAALDNRLGFLGTSGSGKTYNAGGAVERLLKHKARVVIVDPLGVWWGLRLLADGKRQSPFNVAIFGGPRGDLPLTEHAGALIGETAATMAESCIIDLRELGAKASERRFMMAFLETLYRKANDEPFHLIVDEADLFAPQKPAKGAETLLGDMENIVRRGRVKGFIPWLISQRPAVLNKNVLSQVDGLIAFKLTSSQDRDALDAWIEGQADKAQARAIKDQLPALEVGQGVIWLPSHGVLTTAKFPPKETFDSSRTPKRGEKAKRTAALKPLNLNALQERLAVVEAEAKANDPKKLRSEIVGLKAERDRLQKQAEAAKPAKAVPDKDAIEAAEKRGFERAKKQLAKAAEKSTREAMRAFFNELREKVKPLDRLLSDQEKAARTQPFNLDVRFAPDPSVPAAAPAPMPRPAPSVLPRSPSHAPAAPIGGGNGTYTGAQMKILRSLAMWRALGFERPSRAQVAAVAGYSYSSGGFANLLSQLNSVGAIGYPSAGLVSLNVDGIDVMSREEGADMMLSVLSNAQKKIVAAVADGEVHDRAAVAEASGYSPTSGGFANLLSMLSTLGVISYPETRKVQIEAWAVELLAGTLRAA